MIKLLIDDVEVDVLQTESIVGEYSIAPIGNVSKRTGARSITFKLPKTAKNRAVFESCEVLTSQSVKPYRRLKARLYVDGVDMNMLFFTLERVKDYYEGRVYGSNVDFFATIKDKQLRDLDLAAYNHYWDYITVQNSRFNSSGYIYAIINWNTEDSILSNDVKEAAQRLLVSMYAETLLNEICIQSGYTFTNRLLIDSDYNAQDLIVPFNTDKYERNNDLRRIEGKFYTVTIPTGSPTGLLFSLASIISQREIYWNSTSINLGGNILIVDECTLDFKLHLELFNIGATEAVSIDIYDTQTPSGLTLVSTTVINVPPTALTDPPFIQDITETLSFVNQTSGLKRIEIIVRSPSGSNVFSLVNTCTVELSNAQSFLDSEWNVVNNAKHVAWGATIDDYVTVANLMPDLKQSDFVKDFLLLHGAVLQVNEQLKIVTLSKFEDVLNNIGRAIDWSGRVDFIEENTVEFQLDYAQNNLLKYADEEGVVKPDGTDGNLTVDDENLELEKDFITLNFGATVATNWFNNPNNPVVYDTPQIKVLEGGVVTNQTEPRWLYLTKLDGYFHTYRDGVFITDHNTSIPITWFIDPVRANSLGFGTNIYQRYYSFLEGILDRTKVIECRVRLGASDIALLDFLRPVYIKELDGYFFVSKVKFDYTSNKSSIVELVKLL